MNDKLTINLTPLASACRLLIEARLKVAQGTNGRFQPTGFPDQGPARYKGIREFEETTKDGNGAEKKHKVLRVVDILFSDTAASLANWLEAMCLDGDDYNQDCQGIPYVRVLDGGGGGNPKPFLTSSVREPHRLASDYVLDAKRAGGQETFKQWLGKKDQCDANKQRPVRPWLLAQRLFHIDPGCVLHGVFLERLDGRLRLSRLVSGYIEAANPNSANFGGVLRGEVTAKDNIPFPKQEFTSDDIRASFIIHLATLQGYGLTDHQQWFLVLWALYKIDRFLNACPRLRSACEFEVIPPVSATYDGGPWPWPSSGDIRHDFLVAKDKCFPRMADGADDWARRRVQVVEWEEEIEPTAEPLSQGMAAREFDFGEFSNRVEVREHDFGTKRKPEKKLAVVVKGNWDGEDFEEINKVLALFHEKIDKDDETSAENPIHAVVKASIDKHRKKLQNRKKEKEKKAQEG